MKVLKYLGIGIAVLIAGYLVWCLVSPAKMEVSKSITIDKDKAFVYEVAKDFNFYMQWNPFSKMEPAAKRNITGTGREIGDIYSWDGTEIGKGSLMHAEYVENEKIVNKLEFLMPYKSTAVDEISFKEEDGKTVVTWSTNGNEPSPFLMRPMMAMMLNKSFEQGLADLKKLIEGMADLPAPKSGISTASAPVIEETPAMEYLAIKDSCPVGEISAHMQAAYGKLQGYMKENNIEATGMPMAIYWSYDPNGTTTFEAAMPVKAGTKGKGDIYSGKISGGKSVCSTHLGDYAKTGDAHMAIDKFVKENKLKVNEAIEVYENDPATVKPEELRTKIIYPVKG